MIEITVVFHGEQIDLLVPGLVTFDRLYELFELAFRSHGTTLPTGFSLTPLDKAISFNGTDVVAEVGVANGDRFAIRTEGESCSL